MSPEVIERYGGSYTEPQPYVLAGLHTAVLRSPAHRKWLRVILVAALLTGLVFAVIGVADQGLGAFLAQYSAPLLIGLAFACFGHIPDRVPATTVGAQTLTARTGMLTQRAVPWTDVLAILSAARFEHHAVALLGDGGRLALPGLPEEVARGLASAVADARARAPHGASLED